MDKPLQPICVKLNKTYRAALKRNEWTTGTDSDNWGDAYWKHTESGTEVSQCIGGETINCCGINELQFEGGEEMMHAPKSSREELVAKIIRNISSSDKRVMIVGLPVRVQRGSNYNARYYRELRRILTNFGFQKVNNRPYRNSNSRNYLTVMVGQF